MEKEKKKIKETQAVEEAVSTPEQETISEVVANVDELKIELEKANQRAAENFEGWQRERADFLNYKKRVERDQISTLQAMKGDIYRKFLDVLDDLERALKTKPAEGDGAAWAEGIECIYRKLLNSLEANGVTQMDVANKEFDPNLHEAITHEESPDHESGQIIEVIEQGYILGDRVIRPARVRVAR
jgi:molecular chaperone GrpE